MNVGDETIKFMQQKLRSLLGLMAKNVRQLPPVASFIEINAAINKIHVGETDFLARTRIAFMILHEILEEKQKRETTGGYPMTTDVLESMIPYLITHQVQAGNKDLFTCKQCGRIIDPFSESDPCNDCKDKFKKKITRSVLKTKLVDILNNNHRVMMDLVREHASRNKLSRVDDPSGIGKQDMIDAILIEMVNLVLESNGIDDPVTIDDLDG